MLARNPGFTLVAIITLALAIGANTAIFSVTKSSRARTAAGPAGLAELLGFNGEPDVV